MMTAGELGILIILVINSISSFANVLDASYILENFSWLDLLVSFAFLEITWDFFLALVYGDYLKEY